MVASHYDNILDIIHNDLNRNSLGCLLTTLAFGAFLAIACDVHRQTQFD